MERLILGKYTCWWVGIRAECARRATFLGRVIWWILSSGSDVLYVGGTVAGMLFCMYLQSGKIKLKWRMCFRT